MVQPTTSVSCSPASVRAAAGGIALFINALVALADGAWQGTVPPGQVCPTNLRVAVSVALVGTSTDADQTSLPFSGSANVRMTPSQAPFETLRFVDLSLLLGQGAYHMDFFCAELPKCQAIDITINSISMDLAAPATVALAADGSFTLSADFNVHFVSTTTGVSTGAHDVGGLIPITLSGTFSTVGNIARIENMSMSEFVFETPPSSMPVGVASTNFIRPLFTGENRIVGPWSAVSHADLNADGAVNGADLAVMLGSWGASGAIADLDGNGTVDAIDMSQLLAAWG